ncbi:glutamate synthase-related protein, partial [Paenibacillus apiarius]|nr:glutamate synthase-related protein [Paenibacillus apiarius]
IIQRCGSALSSQAAGPKIAWVADTEPELFARARRLFMPSSWLAYRLTGRYLLDHHSASQCTPFYDTEAQDWHRPWIDPFAPGLGLPPLCWPGDVAGEVMELLAAETGLPVGIKSAVGDLGFWEELATLMRDTGRGVDFVTVDGGEGGTGAAPLIFSDSVSLPFQQGFSRVYRTFAERDLHESVVFVGAGKLGLPDNAVVAFALGADMVNVGREAMLAIG